MDLLKEEEALIGKKKKALENLERKRSYFFRAQTSFRKARRELKAANIRLRAFRKEHKFELADLRTDPVVIHSPIYKPVPADVPEDITKPKVVENVPRPVEENTD